MICHALLTGLICHWLNLFVNLRGIGSSCFVSLPLIGQNVSLFLIGCWYAGGDWWRATSEQARISALGSPSALGSSGALGSTGADFLSPSSLGLSSANLSSYSSAAALDALYNHDKSKMGTLNEK